MIDPTLLEGMSVRIEELERRVAKLERGQKAPEPGPAKQVSPSPVLAAVPMPQGSGFLSTMGRAMLGIAGAYLLRAVGESGWISEAVLAPFAIVYALAWLVVAARASRPLAHIAYACTSVLILAPMLWELTTRFQALPAWADAMALAAMAVLAFGLSRSAENAAVLRIADLAVASLALALAVATHANLPFLAVLLLLVVLCEFAGIGRRLSVTRGLVALSAGLGVWLLIYIYRGAHADYPEIGAAGLIAPGFVLFGIAAASSAFSAGVKRERISVFSTLQTVIAFLLAACGLLYFGPSSRLSILGAVCMLLAAAAYVALFTVLRDDVDGRNRTVVATWSAALLLAGSFLLVPAQWRTHWLGLSAIVATAVGVRANAFLLAVHGNALLLAAAIASGLCVYAWQALAGTLVGAPPVVVCVALACAVVCYVILRGGSNGFAQAVAYVFVAAAAIGIAGLVAHGIIALATLSFAPGAPQLALIRSFTLCAVALALASGAARWRRRELTHIAYAALALEAVKLVAEDMRHGQLAYIAASVCLFAVTLIALPLVAKKSRNTRYAGTRIDVAVPGPDNAPLT